MTDGPRYSGKYPKAWEIIGRLTSYWARYESAIYGTLRTTISGHWADWDDSTLILANGLRYGDAINTLTRLAKAKKLPKAGRECLDDIIKEARRVKDIRDVVAHRDFAIVGVGDWRYEFQLWNRRSVTDPRVAYYWPDEIEACAQYANRLSQRVTGELDPLLRGVPIEATEEQLQAWREKPPLPKAPHSDFRRTQPEYPLQPLALERLP